jgi:pimeloyl-ACP methyl ester carboxylesterase
MTEFITTPTLRIAYERHGQPDGSPVIFLHGWPDDIRTYDATCRVLRTAGLHMILPWLRGFGSTTFTSTQTMRSGEIVAFAQDVLDLADALKLDTFAIVGHDWGARVAYVLAATHPERVSRICAMSVGWQPGDVAMPDFEQARHYWYQWFMATKLGAQAVRDDPRGFALTQWKTWSPPGWFDEAEFEATARSFGNPDWTDVTVHSYRVRWNEADKDATYRELDLRARSAKIISVPTLVIHGLRDTATLPAASADQERFFVGGYDRHVLEGVGHFPTREAPDKVAALLLSFLRP